MNIVEREAFKRDILQSLHCALPCVVVSFDAAYQTVDVQPVFQFRESRSRSGSSSLIDYPLLRDVPVFFPGTRQSGITWMVQPGDECLVIFADSAIDRWFDSGEKSEERKDRFHDLSDAFAFVGFRSRPNRLQDFPETPSFFGGDPP